MGWRRSYACAAIAATGRLNLREGPVDAVNGGLGLDPSVRPPLMSTSTRFRVLTSHQDVPTSVASEQLNAALNAGVEGPVAGTVADGGVSVPMIFLFTVMLTLLLVLAWLQRRERVASTAGAAGRAPAEAGTESTTDGSDAGSKPPQPPEMLALPPHVVAALARRKADRNARDQASGSEEAPDPEGRQSEGRPRALDGLDVIIGD